MIFKHLSQSLKLNIKNISGWRTSRKIVTIECDDWGSIRMPSRKVYDNLKSADIPLSKNRFIKFDTLADKKDLECLFEVLQKIKDSNRRAAVMTPFCNVANPDFQKIKESGYKTYHYEPFITTLEKYGRHVHTFNMWKTGIAEKIFIPEFHGRDHVAVQFWLAKLLEGDNNIIRAFENNFISIDVPNIHPALQGFRPEFYFNTPDQKPFLKKAIKEGTKLFKDLFGINPRVFVPSNNIFHSDFENEVVNSGIKFLNVNHLMPYPDVNGEIKFKYYITGKRSAEGLTYYIRNCAFEPTSDNYKGIDLTLKQIEVAFRWGKPATISTHRVNFVGGIDTRNRDKGLTELNKLLKAIVNKWPDVEFMSAGDALEFMCKNN